METRERNNKLEVEGEETEGGSEKWKLMVENDGGKRKLENGSETPSSKENRYWKVRTGNGK